MTPFLPFRVAPINRTKHTQVVKFLDKRIGAFVDMLEQEGWLENSVIVVASDNGACPSDGGTNYPLRGSKQSVYEGGSKVNLCRHVDSYILAGYVICVLPALLFGMVMLHIV